MPAPIPAEIRRSGLHDVAIRWSDGHETLLLARELRLSCPCALCRDEMTGSPRLDPASVPETVHPLSLQPVGRYAIKVSFSDGHDTGIYTYEYLRGLCRCAACAGGADREA